MNSTLKVLALLAGLAALPAAALNHEDIVSPISPGRFVVACSNLEQDEALIPAGASASDFWDGQAVDGRPRYITEILKQPSSALVFDVAVPDVRSLYPGNAGGRVPHAMIVCHPTSRTNTDPDYVLPGSDYAVPRMQPPGHPPKLISRGEFALTLGLGEVPSPGEPARLPLIVYSHGLSGSPIGKGYIEVMEQLAAQGYMVAAVFHGDPRFSRVRLEDFSDYWYALTNFDRIAEMQLMRPLALKAMTDVLLAHPGFAPGIDAERIGGFGASMGGQAMAHLLGARMTTSLGLACRETARDPRIKAAVGFVPYAGQSWLPAFCDDQAGAEDVNRPYLAITGTQDTTAPPGLMEQALHRFGSSRYLVSLLGGQHELRSQDVGDLFTWMVTFFNAYLPVAADPTAMHRLIRMRGVQGGREDTLVVDVHVPSAHAGGEVSAMEFHNVHLDHYFVAAGTDEIEAILAGSAGPGWELTGQAFKVWPQMPADTMVAAAPVCRFYGGLNGGPNSHFFTAESGECEEVKGNGGWFYEGIGFHIRRVDADGRCPAGWLEVNRAYNDRFAQNDSNHRFSTSDSTMREMSRHGWVVEGTVMCARP